MSESFSVEFTLSEAKGLRLDQQRPWFSAPQVEPKILRFAQDELLYGSRPIETGHVPVSSKGRSDDTISISTSAMLSTTHSKFASPTELRSASGAQCMKSMAYGMPSRTASSTVFMS